MSFWSFIFLVIVVYAAVEVVRYHLTPECPHCGTREGARWFHQRGDGKQDRRFKRNPKICTLCHGNMADKGAGFRRSICRFARVSPSRKMEHCPDYPAKPNEICKKCGFIRK